MVEYSDSGCGGTTTRMGRSGRRSRLPSMVILCVVYLVSVQSAPTSLPDCVPPTDDTCQSGYYAAPCDPGSAVVSGCRPCPEGTFSDTSSSITEKTSCKARMTCDEPYMTYLWRGDSTSDAVCHCTSGYHLNTSSYCVPDDTGTISAEHPEGDRTQKGPAPWVGWVIVITITTAFIVLMYDTGTVSAEHPEGDRTQKGPAPWVGWVIVITITVAFIALMCIFWFWTPCLRGEPDYGDDGPGSYVKTSLLETERLVSKDLSDEEDAVAVTYAVKRLPGLVPLTPKYTQEFLSALLKTASAAPGDTANGQSAEASREELERGLQDWQADPSRSARFADLVEAMSSTGYGQKAQQLTQEVYTHLKHTNPLL